MSAGLERALNLANFVFAGFFVLEMIIKIAGLGFQNYWNDKFNRFDAIIACLSIVEYLIEKAAVFTVIRAFRAVRSLRMIRVLRVVKIVRYLESLQRLVWVISKSLTSMSYIAMLLFLFIFCYAILGMQLFGGKFHFPEYPPDDDVPRANFDSFLSSIVTVFQILTLENWNSVMYDGMRGVSYPALVYYVSWVVVGVYCLLNMFLAIVLQNFERDQKRQLEKRIYKHLRLERAKTTQGKQLALIKSALTRFNRTSDFQSDIHA
eukprot:1012462_1